VLYAIKPQQGGNTKVSVAALQAGSILQATTIRHRHTEGPSVETNLPD